MQQKRLIIALLISTAILFLWSYLVPSPQPVAPPANQPSPQQTATPQSTPVAGSTPLVNPSPVASAAPTDSGNAAPHRIVSIRTPLYEAKLDTLGAEAISWIIKKNRDSAQDIYSVASNKQSKVPLELVSQEGLRRQPREAPLQLSTGEASVDNLLTSKNYFVDGIGNDAGDELTLAPGEKKRITFLLNDKATGLDVVKTIVLDADSYVADLEITIKRGGQILPQAKVRVGPSIGDQGIKSYTFYSVAPEAVAAVGEEVQRHLPQAINENKNSPDRLTIAGPVDWAGVGDTYFAMVVVPAGKLEGLELQTTQYDYSANGAPEKRYLITAWVPVPTDGSRSAVYTGPKDHYLLTQASAQLRQTSGRSSIDLEGLIDFGWFSWMSRPLAVPILSSIKWLQKLTGSYGVAIILFTIVIYSLFFPLKWRSSKSMKKAQKLAPRMKELQEKIKGMKQNDPRLKELQVEQLRLMKEGNPLGGCLPLLIQMPFLFALYRAITISLDFRQASFLWLPDLSAPEPYFIHILPILMAGTMVVLQLITPAPSADPLQRKMMAVGMPLFMLYVLWSAPSGLLLYWLVGNIVGFAQQFVINKWTNPEGSEPAEVPDKKSLKKGSGTVKGT
ncbi:MAG TPA: membrane protein insertase YidC [Pyrinomonadaceae bacterium]|nr:membrane protein insertase YidC [Pyrinomonadaceae bacterium]